MSDIEPSYPVILIKSQSILQRGAAKLHFLCTKPKKPTLTRRNKENRQHEAAGLKSMVPPGRFERPTPALGERCSIP